eukprot:scaffold30965_cov19-Tisochrysis_lutea.AAC.1
MNATYGIGAGALPWSCCSNETDSKAQSGAESCVSAPGSCKGFWLRARGVCHFLTVLRRFQVTHSGPLPLPLLNALPTAC